MTAAYQSNIDDHYENFPVASWLCPPALRAPIKAIYAFARIADDIADEGDASVEQRLAALAAYQADLNATLGGKPPAHTPWPALASVIREHGIQGAPLRDLLRAFTQDVTTTRYANNADLIAYCSLSANPIGRLLLHLYGVHDASSQQQSDCICTALQLINFWQDVGVDALKNPLQGRIYLPLASLARFDVSEAQITQRQYSSKFAALMKHECEDARTMMLRGAPLTTSLKGRIGWELRLVVQGGLRILHKIERVNYNVFEKRPTLGKLDMLVMGWKALWMR